MSNRGGADGWGSSGDGHDRRALQRYYGRLGVSAAHLRDTVAGEGANG